MKKLNLNKVNNVAEVLKAKVGRKPKKTKRTRAKKTKKVMVRFSAKRTVWGLAVVMLSLLAFWAAKSGWIVAALINNQPISRLEVVRRLEKQGGKQTLDNIMTETLILQEAKKTNSQVSKEEVAGRIKKISDQLEGQGRNLDEVLAASGQTRQDVEKQLKLQLIVEKIVGKEVKISDEQVQKEYDQNKDTRYKDKKLDEVKDQIRSQLFQENVNLKARDWIEKLKNNANIRYFVKF